MKLPKILQFLPVPILKGPARGKLWTFYPYSAYWRLGGHEPEMALAIELAGDLRGKVAWDCGAHFGIYTLVFSCLVGTEGQAVAFEPDPVSYERVSRHMRMNNAANVVALQVAASDATGESFIVVRSGSGATTSHLLYHDEILAEATPTKRIKCARPDDMVAAGRIRHPDFIKLDVEGHGGHALRGAAASIACSLPFIVASMHSSHEIEGMRSVLEPLGYGVECFTVGKLESCNWEDCAVGRNYVLRCRGK
jgi:FkbM family methyltransferase